MEHPNGTNATGWRYTYHRIRNSYFFWALLGVIGVLAALLAIENAGSDTGFEGRKVPLTVFTVLACIVLISYCITAHYNGMEKVYYYALQPGQISYFVPEHRLTDRQVGNSEYVRMYFERMSYGVGEDASYKLTRQTIVTPRPRLHRIVLTGPGGRFIVRAEKADYDTVLEKIREAIRRVPAAQ